MADDSVLSSGDITPTRPASKPLPVGSSRLLMVVPPIVARGPGERTLAGDFKGDRNRL
jgi:hypothetical protein